MIPELNTEALSAPTPSEAPSLLRSRLFRRLLAGALPGLVAALFVGVVAVITFNDLGSQNRVLVHALEIRSVAKDVTNSLDDTILALDWLTAPASRYSSTVYAGYRAILARDQDSLRALNLSDLSLPDQQSRDRVVTHLDDVLRDLDRLDTVTSSDQAAGAALWTDLRRNTANVRVEADHLATSWRLRSDQLGQSTADLTFWGVNRIIIITVLAILAALVITALLTRRIMWPIQRLREHMTRTATGDLTALTLPLVAHDPARNTDELVALEAEYQHTLNTLRPLISRIQEDAAHISSSAAEISAAAAQQASGSSEQASAITEVTVTVEQLNQTAVQIAEAAASVAAAAEQALVSANRGQEAVRDSIMGMAMIKARVNDITTRILALSEQSQRISEVIDLINTIAAQTHILALNAAVESADAGEYGQRFGVVAAEVKKLAQRSVAATKEVRVIIGQIQAATSAAVMATEEGLKETDRGVSLAHQSGDANDDIISMVERTAQLANAISLATQQQRTASEQVVATMREVAEVTRQAAASSQQASGAANELSDIAHELRSASQGFKLASDGPEHGPDAGDTGDSRRADRRSGPLPLPVASGEGA
jgi:methyl-accepting chemotaxis protein